MNAKHIVAAIALIASTGAVMADAIYPANEKAQQTAVAGKTRAQVYAELVQARADGTIPNYSTDSYPAEIKTASTVTRQEVRADLAKAIQSGELNNERIEQGS